MSPFYICHGRLPILPLECLEDVVYTPRETDIHQYSSGLYYKIREILIHRLVFENSLLSMQGSAETYNKGTHIFPYKVGDKVLVKKMFQQGTYWRPILAKFEGPKVIHEFVSSHAYIVKDIKSGKLQMITHDRMRPYNNDAEGYDEKLPVEEEDARIDREDQQLRDNLSEDDSSTSSYSSRNSPGGSDEPHNLQEKGRKGTGAEKGKHLRKDAVKGPRLPSYSEGSGCLDEQEGDGDADPKSHLPEIAGKMKLTTGEERTSAAESPDGSVAGADREVPASAAESPECGDEHDEAAHGKPSGVDQQERAKARR